MNYNAFISYRHSDLDMFVAKQVHKRLETFKVPRKVQKETGIKKIERVFRDQEELPIGSNLSDNISQALENSEYLIVICSPRTPESYWVQTEIKTFIEMHDRDHVLAVLIEGEPEESFPEPLRFDEQGNPVEPLAADVRGATQAEMKKKMPTEFMRLAAPLLHCTYDDLRQRHKERQMHRMMAIMGGVMTLGIAFGAYYAYTAAQIQQNYKDKQVNQSKYLADTSLDLLEHGDRITAMQVALEALPCTDNRPYVPQAEYALGQSLNLYTDGSQLGTERVLECDLPVSDFQYSADAKNIIVKDDGDNLYIFRIEDGELLCKLSDPLAEEDYTPVYLKGFGATESDTLIVGYEDRVVCYDMNGKEQWTQKLPHSEYMGFNGFYYNKDAHLGVAVATDEIIVISDQGEIVMDYTNPTEEDLSFTASFAAFSPDGKHVAVRRYVDDDTVNGEVSIFDVTTGEFQTLHTSYDAPSEAIYIDDNHIAIASNQRDEQGILLSGLGAVDYIDLTTGETLWTSDYEFQTSVISGSSLEFFYSDFTGKDGNQYQLLNYYLNNHFCSIDINTGEKWFAFDKSSTINGYHYSGDNMVILWELGGQMDIVTIDDRIEHTDNMKDTKKNIRKAKARGGVIAIKESYSSKLVLMSYPQDPNLESFTSFDTPLDDAFFTEDGKYVVANRDNSEGTDNELVIYDYATGKQLGDVLPCKSFAKVRVGRNHDLFVYESQTLTKYEITDEGFKVTGTFENLSSANDYPFDMENYSFLSYGYGGFAVVDLDTMEIRFQDDQIDVFLADAGGVDNNTVAFVSKDNVLHVKNCKNHSEKIIREDSMKTMLTTAYAAGLALSDDGKYVAMNCLDYTVRIYNLEQEKIVAEVPFGGRQRAFVEFTPDSKNLLLQGDDYYLQVYNLEKQAMIQTGSTQLYTIDDVEYLTNEQGEVEKIALHNRSSLYLLTPDTFDVTAEIVNGCDISLQNDII
ncbi:MAG: TIR domain-containing protein, partial [Lachnospiraceae bacterium]|nr:TIR domain-containing protein [Lachnospiraceae bacterium]